MSNQIKLFMTQKQKLKSERGNLNVGIKDMFMTMDPEAFRIALELPRKPGVLHLVHGVVKSQT